jgi:flagellar FliL protein
VAEEKKEEAKAAPAAPAPAVTSSGGGGGGPKPIILIAIAVLNMISMGAVAFILWSSHKAEQKKPKIDDVIEGVHKEDSERDPASVNKEDIVGKLIPMETFLVNLAGSRGSKLVKMNIELELENEAVMSEIEKRKPQIRDKVIILLSSKNYEFMSSKEGKIALRDEIKGVINEFLSTGKIKNIYFTDLVVN